MKPQTAISVICRFPGRVCLHSSTFIPRLGILDFYTAPMLVGVLEIAALPARNGDLNANVECLLLSEFLWTRQSACFYQSVIKPKLDRPEVQAFQQASDSTKEAVN